MLKSDQSRFEEHDSSARYRRVAAAGSYRGGAGIVVHAGLVLLRQLADRTGLTGGLPGRWPAAGCWCMFGPVASVPTAWRTLAEIASGGEKTARKVVAAVNAARRPAWAAIEARTAACRACGWRTGCWPG